MSFACQTRRLISAAEIKPFSSRTESNLVGSPCRLGVTAGFNDSEPDFDISQGLTTFNGTKQLSFASQSEIWLARLWRLMALWDPIP